MKHWRIYLLTLVIFFLGSGILARLFTLQILQYDYYHAWAQNQHEFQATLFPQRGQILMQDLSSQKRDGQEHYSPLAINKEFKQVYLVPKDISDQIKNSLVDQLVEILNLDKQVISERINKSDDPYEPLKHKLDQATAQEIEQLDIKGLGLISETWRYYPNNTLASHIAGFVGIVDEEKVGQYGLEGYYQDELKGQTGFLAGQKDISGYGIPSLNQKIEHAQNGVDLVLTIDENIQFKVEKELKQVIEQWQAESGTIIVMEPKTGAIRAMVSWPAFDPNEYSQVEDINFFLNPVTQEVYEPGSVFKPITMAAGLDSNKVSPETKYIDNGYIKIKGSFISNVDGRSYDQQTMTQVLEKSLNTGAVFVQQTVGLDIFQDYVERFNLDQPTGIDLGGETYGNISNLYTGRDINLATISFGQGITVTPLGLIVAIGSIANQGDLMRPYLVEKIIYPDKSEKKTLPERVGQTISPATAKTLTKMLVSVVENGYGKPAMVPGYDIAGKTGTAQVSDLEQGGYTEETIHSFIGYAPAYDPQFIILVKLDKPQGIRFASDSVSPVFKRIAKYLLDYLEIPPQ